MSNRVQMQKVTSQNLKQVGYDKAKRELHCQFNYSGNKVYVYVDVPERVYKELVAADSVGKYFHAKIRYRYNEGKGYYGSG